jgi:hypothetical protein
MSELRKTWDAMPKGRRSAYLAIFIASVAALVLFGPSAYRVVVPSGPPELEASPEANAELQDMQMLTQMSVADLRAEVKKRQDEYAKVQGKGDQAAAEVVRARMMRAKDELFSAEASRRK